jgi:hypothetical protein
MARDLFAGLVIPRADEYACDSAGVPNWKKRYLIPLSNVMEGQVTILPVPRVATPGGAAYFSASKPAMEVDSKGGISLLPFDSPKEPWGGPRDLSGKLFLAHDGKYLYLKVLAVDDLHVDPPEDPPQMWKADSIQVGIATAAGRKNLECGLARRGDQTLFAVWQSPVPGAEAQIEKKATASTGKIEYTLRVPLDFFGFKPGDLFGLSALINDADKVERKAFLEFGSGIGSHKDPGSYGAYRLAP